MERNLEQVPQGLKSRCPDRKKKRIDGANMALKDTIIHIFTKQGNSMPNTKPCPNLLLLSAPSRKGTAPPQ
jgi:hypothetical protein